MVMHKFHPFGYKRNGWRYECEYPKTLTTCGEVRMKTLLNDFLCMDDEF
jgi:hypothetical protein